MNTGGFSAAGSAQPVIWADKGKAHLAADQGMEALVRAGRDIYARGPQLVHPCRIPARAANGAAISPPGVLVIAQSWLRRELAKVATWQYHTAKGEVRDCDPPEIVAEQILVMVQDWAFPTLAAVTSAPFLRPDGDLVATEGFDPVSGYMLMDLPAMPLIPTRPTKDSAARALQEIESLLDEFPFVTEVDRSVGLSLVMTPTLRPTFDGWAPLHTLGSPESGTGKSFLLDIASMIATGNWCPVIAATRDPAELDKKLAAVLIAAMPIVSIDNVNRLLSSDLLAQAVERPQLTLRPLGTSQTIIVPNVSTIAVNGNNLRVVDDLVRRTLHAALDADCEAPEQRTFSKDPLAMVRARRGAFIAKILTIARAYIAAGFPEKPAPLPSFQSWGDLIRGALIWLGRADPVVSITRGRAEDPHRQALAAFLESFPTEQVGYTAAELIEAAAAQLGMGRPQWPGLQDALREAATDKRGHLSTERLGYWLRSQKGRVAGRWKLCHRGLTKRREWFREERRPRDRGSDGSDRDDDSVYARVNSEIHIGTNTNHGPDRFIASDDEAPL